MGYVEQSLISGEQIILKAKLHWAMFISPVLFLLIGLLGVIFSLIAATDQNSPGSGLVCCGGLFFLVGIVNGIFAIMAYFTTEFALTNKRVIAKAGIIRRRSVELMLGKVESIQVKEPLLGRIFNYGTLIVIGSGGTKEPFPNIANAMELRKQITNYLPS